MNNKYIYVGTRGFEVRGADTATPLFMVAMDIVGAPGEVFPTDNALANFHELFAKNEYILVIDDNGIANRKPVNPLVSGTWYPGTIYGDALIFGTVFTDEGPDWRLLDDEEAEAWVNALSTLNSKKLGGVAV